MGKDTSSDKPWQWPDLPSPPSYSRPSAGSRPPEPPQRPPEPPDGPPGPPNGPRKRRWWWPSPATGWGAFYYAVLGGLVVWTLITVIPHIHLHISVTWHLALPALEELKGVPGSSLLTCRAEFAERIAVAG